MRTITMEARLGKDAELLTTKTGEQYLAMRVANTEKIKGEDDTLWADVVSYDKHVIEKLRPYLKKGSAIHVTGFLSIKMEEYEGKHYLRTYIRAYNISFPSISTKKNEGTTSSNPFIEEGSSPSMTNVGTTFNPTIETSVKPQSSYSVSMPDNVSAFNTTSNDDDELPF